MSNLNYYQTLLSGAGLKDGCKLQVQLTQDEAALVLKLHDYGVNELSPDEVQLLYSVIGKMKDIIWP